VSSTSTRQNNSQSLPERWKRRRQRAALGCLLALILLTGALQGQGGAEQLGAWWLRACFSLREELATRLGGPVRDPRIVLVEIDDKSVRNWPEPMIAWGDHLAAAINQMNRSGARLIAMDWTQPAMASKYLNKDYEQNLMVAFSQSRGVVMVKFIRANSGEVTSATDKEVIPAPTLLYALPGAAEHGPETCLGFADLPGKNNIKSSYYPTLPSLTKGVPPSVSFAQRIVERSGLEVRPGPAPRGDGSILLNFANNTGERDANSPFERISIADLENAKQPDPRLKDKIVIVGARYKGDNDTHSVPFMAGLVGTREVAGMEVQANAVRTLLDGSSLKEPEGLTVWLLSALFGAVGVGALTLLAWGKAVRFLVSLLVVWAVVSFCVFCGANTALPVVLPFISLLFGAVLMGGYRALSEERERAQVMKIWGRHQDPRLIDELLAHPEWRGGQGKEVEVTVLFADLKNFTKTVEHLTPQHALEALNRYLALLSSIILEHGGVVDKYLGDGLMAQWGTPAARPDHATAAVRACLDIEQRIATLTQEVVTKGGVSFEVRLTLHTGKVVAGPLGSDQRLEYTIIGDTVNVTSRLQETAKALGCDFLISETTCAALNGAVNTGRETQVEIRGRNAALRVFEVLDGAIHPSGSEAVSSAPAPNGQNVPK
jgi:adenylate cyclase